MDYVTTYGYVVYIIYGNSLVLDVSEVARVNYLVLPLVQSLGGTSKPASLPSLAKVLKNRVNFVAGEIQHQ